MCQEKMPKVEGRKSNVKKIKAVQRLKVEGRTSKALV
jgi:hypothetical protein